MRADQIEALRQQQAALAQQLQGMLDTPEAERPKAPKELRAWLRDLETAQQALQQIDHLITLGERRQSRAQVPAPTMHDIGADEVVLARIPKGPRAELQVRVKTWMGRRVVDVRCWAAMKGAAELKPSRKGVMVDAKHLQALVDALRSAQQHA